MKTSITGIALYLLMACASLTSCTSSSEKVDQAEQEVLDAQKDLDDANKAYLADVESYKKETADKIAANQKSIDDFNQRKAEDKMAVKAEYQQEMAELEQKNIDMKKRLDNYQADGKENWESFKTEFSRDMDALGNSFKDFFTKSN